MPDAPTWSSAPSAAPRRYERFLGPFRAAQSPLQLLEIGFYKGAGTRTFMKYLPAAEVHCLEISCGPKGSRLEGKWPYINDAVNAPGKLYARMRNASRLHCGDQSDLDFLDDVWARLRRPGAPPLMAVIDDGSHKSADMLASVFYWFPKIAPGGVLVVEDIQPFSGDVQRGFKAVFLRKLLSDVHYCGSAGDPEMGATAHFPTLQPLLRSVHCELHICVLERNDAPADTALSREALLVPLEACSPKAPSCAEPRARSRTQNRAYAPMPG